MALQPIPFSDGTGADLLTKATGIQYDTALNSAAIAHTGCTIASGANNCLVHGDTNAVGANADNVFIGGSINSTVNSSDCAIIGAGGGTIGTGAITSVIIGGSGNVISNNASSAIVIGDNSTASDIAAITIGGSNVASAISALAMGDTMTVSGTHSLGWNDGNAAATLSTTRAVGFYPGNGMVLSTNAGDEPAASCLLTMNATNHGLRVPVVASSASIATPSAGMIIYSTGDANFMVYNGTWNVLLPQISTSINSTVSGIWAASQNITYKISRVGIYVTICYDGGRATANTSSTITSVAGVVPTAYRPSSTSASGFYRKIDNAAVTVGNCTVTSAGTITWVNGTGGAFSGSGDSGIAGTNSITYAIF